MNITHSPFEYIRLKLALKKELQKKKNYIACVGGGVLIRHINTHFT